MPTNLCRYLPPKLQLRRKDLIPEYPSLCRLRHGNSLEGVVHSCPTVKPPIACTSQLFPNNPACITNLLNACSSRAIRFPARSIHCQRHSKEVRLPCMSRPVVLADTPQSIPNVSFMLKADPPITFCQKLLTTILCDPVRGSAGTTVLVSLIPLLLGKQSRPSSHLVPFDETNPYRMSNAGGTVSHCCSFEGN